MECWQKIKDVGLGPVHVLETVVPAVLVPIVRDHENDHGPVHVGVLEASPNVDHVHVLDDRVPVRDRALTSGPVLDEKVDHVLDLNDDQDPAIVVANGHALAIVAVLPAPDDRDRAQNAHVHVTVNDHIAHVKRNEHRDLPDLTVNVAPSLLRQLQFALVPAAAKTLALLPLKYPTITPLNVVPVLQPIAN